MSKNATFWAAILGSTAILTLAPSSADARDRYRERPPVIVSPDLTAPWVMQLGQPPMPRGQQVNIGVYVQPDWQPGVRTRQPNSRRVVVRETARDVARPDARRPQLVSARPTSRPERVAGARVMDPVFLPQEVAYAGPERPGTIVIDSNSKFLYLVQSDGTARRYGVGVGKEGMSWTGTQTITRKAEWPTWHPPAEMRVRELEKGKVLPEFMDGGPENPLGARAMYLGSTLYRIHGTNAPWTIGTNVSSGCIRLRNEDVIDLYERVKVGTKVIVM